MDRAWKAFERYVASELGTKRIPVNGRTGPDIIAGNLAVEVKLRRSVPKAFNETLAYAEQLGYEAISVFQEGQLHILTRIHKLLDDSALKCVHYHNDLPQTPFGWLQHITNETDLIPCVIMNRTGENRNRSVVLMRFSDYVDKEKECQA